MGTIPSYVGGSSEDQETYGGCIDWHSDKKRKHTGPTYLSQRHPEPRKESAVLTQHYDNTRNILFFLSWEKAFVHFSEDEVSLPNCAILLQKRTKGQLSCVTDSK